MKIAFVGKGGSGKSTMSSLFVRYLQRQAKRSVLAIDADLNMNLSGLLGVKAAEEKLLARPEVAEAIRTHLKGNNSRIASVAQFLPTTPPGSGSNLISDANDAGITSYAVAIAAEPVINLLTVGSYDTDGIGQTCYHSHLFVAENLLSHTVTNSKFAVVCDMVAGTDSFAYSLHLQFDAIILIAEPTPESVEVCRLFLGLARDSGVDSLVAVVANKVVDDDDLKYIRNTLGQEPLAVVPLLPSLKKARQSGQPVRVELLEEHLRQAMKAVERKGETPAITAAERIAMLRKLHLKLNAKQWVQQGYGDVADQIDLDFAHPDFAISKSSQERAGVLV
jgi:CO dehydrogenase maturation factor